MRENNTIKQVQSIKGKINPKYDMNTENIQEIWEYDKNPFYLISNAFKFGYVQGMKAAKAEKCI